MSVDRNLALEFVRVTEAAALACAPQMGHGDERKADQLAVEAMRSMLSTVHFDGTVRIGEGERDQAPMLYIGEKVGSGTGESLDVALDPLEGTTLCAKGGANALSVIAVAEKGNFLHAPDVYMRKIAVGPQAAHVIDLSKSTQENIHNIAQAMQRKPSDLTVVIMERPRHNELIAEVRSTGARIQLISDGDVQPALAAGLEQSNVDVLMGIGGAPEGVLAAAALRCLGGGFQGQLIFHKKGGGNITDHEQIERARQEMGIEDIDKIYTTEELARGEVIFCATGVTEGSLLKGVEFTKGGKATTHSLVMRSRTGTLRLVHTEHNLTKHPKGSHYSGST